MRKKMRFRNSKLVQKLSGCIQQLRKLLKFINLNLHEWNGAYECVNISDESISKRQAFIEKGWEECKILAF